MVLLVLATKYLYIIALYLIIDNLAITYGSLAREVFPDASGQMGSNQSTHAHPNSISPMGTKRTPRIFQDLQFRVLVLGRANAGKTSILQRVCETTEIGRASCRERV